MPVKTDLQVPFENAQTVKSLGARFDMARKVWYVPDGVDLWNFRQWLPKDVAKWMKRNKNKVNRYHPRHTK